MPCALYRHSTTTGCVMPVDIPDNAIMTPEQEKAFDATLGTVQRVAMKIVELPRDRRDEAFAIAHRNYAEALRKIGQNPDDGASHAWLEKVMEGLWVLVAEIESSGGTGGGRG